VNRDFGSISTLLPGAKAVEPRGAEAWEGAMKVCAAMSEGKFE
jgi:predicted esterase